VASDIDDKNVDLNEEEDAVQENQDEDNDNGFDLMENVTPDVHQQRRLECENNKLQLIESNWSVTTKSGNCELKWYVTPDSIPLESPFKEFPSIGIRNVNWEKFNSLWTKDKATRSEVP